MASVEIPASHVTADDIGATCLELIAIAGEFDQVIRDRFGGNRMFAAIAGRIH